MGCSTSTPPSASPVCGATLVEDNLCLAEVGDMLGDFQNMKLTGMEHPSSGSDAPSITSLISSNSSSPRRWLSRAKSLLVNKEAHPMLTMAVRDLLTLDVLIPSEEAQSRGLVARLDRESMAVFVSHQWLSWDHPDPDGVQLRCLQKFLRRAIQLEALSMFVPGAWEALVHGTKSASTFSAATRSVIARLTAQCDLSLTPETFAEDLLFGTVWLDFLSIPQRDDGAKLLAIKSIPYYIERSAYFVVLAPRAKNRSTGESCSFSTWRSRGWCRMEESANFLSHHTMTPIIVSEDDCARVVDFVDWLHLLAWNRRAAVVCGEFACCRMNHLRPDGVHGAPRSGLAGQGSRIPCDKGAVLEILRKMWHAKMDYVKKDKSPWGHTIIRVCETKMLAQEPDQPFHACWSGKHGDAPEQVLARIEADVAFKRTTWPAIRIAAALGDERLLEVCVRRGHSPADINPEHGQTSLMLASTGGSLAAVRFLLSQPEVDETFINRCSRGFGITALERAARNGHPEIVAALLQARAETQRARHDTGQTALHAAVQNGHEACVRVLVAAGASLDATTFDGDTPLHLAATSFCLYGDQESKPGIAELLLRAGASPETRNRSGMTPLQVALAGRCASTAEALRLRSL